MSQEQAASLAIAVTNYRNTVAIHTDEITRALKARNAAIVTALDAGVPQKDVAATVGVGREQIRKIAIAHRSGDDS